MLVLASREQPGFSSIAALQPHLIALVKLNPMTAAGHFIAKIALMQKNLARGLARGATNPDSRTYPGAPELTILRLVGSIWSTSDFSHPVVAPAVLLMGQYLGHGRLRRTSDLGSGLMLCSLLAQVCPNDTHLMAITDIRSTRQSPNDSFPNLSISLPRLCRLSCLGARMSPSGHRSRISRLLERHYIYKAAVIQVRLSSLLLFLTRTAIRPDRICLTTLCA